MATAEIIKAPSVDERQLELVRRTVAKDATQDELALFLYDCERRGVHPLDKLIHFTKRQGKYTPITSIDFMRSRAAESGEYAGNDDPIFTEVPTMDGKGKTPDTACVTVYRMVQGQRCAFTATARWSEYFPGDAQGWAWKKMPHIMLGKCAEALALRKAFPQQLAGLYASEEMDQANRAPVVAEPKKRTISGKLNACKALDAYSLAKIDKTPVVVMDGAFDSILAQLGEYEEKRDVEVEVIQKTGPKGKYFELVNILTINGKPYLEGALKESIELVTSKKAQAVCNDCGHVECLCERIPETELEITDRDMPQGVPLEGWGK